MSTHSTLLLSYAIQSERIDCHCPGGKLRVTDKQSTDLLLTSLLPTSMHGAKQPTIFICRLLHLFYHCAMFIGKPLVRCCHSSRHGIL